MRGYAAAVGKGRNCDALIASGWGFMCLPNRLQAHGQCFALDNGAWTAHQKGQRLDELAFYRAVDKVGEHADFVVLPDVVCGGLESLDMSLAALENLADLPAHKLIAVQDGFTVDQITPYLSSDVGIFLGGSTEWKLSTMQQWGLVASRVGCHYHVGRVNTSKRLRMCAAFGADSFDGSGVSRFGDELPRLDFLARQSDLLSPRRLAA